MYTNDQNLAFSYFQSIFRTCVDGWSKAAKNADITAAISFGCSLQPQFQANRQLIWHKPHGWGKCVYHQSPRCLFSHVRSIMLIATLPSQTCKLTHCFGGVASLKKKFKYFLKRLGKQTEFFRMNSVSRPHFSDAISASWGRKNSLELYLFLLNTVFALWALRRKCYENQTT